MKENIILKFPVGMFTHTELALVNGKTNQQVWPAYQKAIADGIIVSAGNRPNSTGKGKPSRIWTVVVGQPVPLVAKVEVVKVPVDLALHHRGVPAAKKEKVAKVEKNEVVAEVMPTVAPTETVVTEVVATVVVEEVPFVRNNDREIQTIKHLCSVCKSPLLAQNDDTGVMVWCSQPKSICDIHENPYGHGRNINDAYEALCDKYKLNR